MNSPSRVFNRRSRSTTPASIGICQR
jgi:hypothetical protein